VTILNKIPLKYLLLWTFGQQEANKDIQSTLDTTNFDITNFTIQRIFGVVQIILY
jgi:hypothetical protein